METNAAETNAAMHHLIRPFLTAALMVLTLHGCGGDSTSQPGSSGNITDKVALGELLFNDINLSLNRTVSCASCHNPNAAFTDDRSNLTGTPAAVSAGDNLALGTRNSPTLTYAALTPEFQSGQRTRFNSRQPDYAGFLGGQFIDGRASTLEDQAGQPVLSDDEMGMPDKASVALRLLENSGYAASFAELFGDDVLTDDERLFEAMTESLAEFQRSNAFSTFDSRYDRALIGEYTYNPLSKATLGRSLFFSQQFTNCATCHQLQPNSNAREPFTNHTYLNIGTPANPALGDAHPGFIDEGLLNNPNVSEQSERGKFRVPTLRNVAVTAPYMHNGVFKELRTVIQFYDHFFTNSTNTVNPETGMAWRAPEVNENVALTELRDGGRLSDTEIDAIVCFLETLTDQRFEHLLADSDCD